MTRVKFPLHTVCTPAGRAGRKPLAMALAGALLLVGSLSGCAQVEDVAHRATSKASALMGGGDDDAAGEVTTTQQAPTFQVDPNAQPIAAPKLEEPIGDPGMKATWQLMGVSSSSDGNVIVHMNLTNNDEAPLPPELLPAPTLTVLTGNQPETVPTMTSTPADGIVGLDLPLGSHATTSIRYKFRIQPWRMVNVELTCGNVIWRGNLSNF